MTPRTYRAGASIEDYCRACKTDRIHTVVAVDTAGTPIRVTCVEHPATRFRSSPSARGLLLP
jgi:hypothetical protein